MDVTPRALTEMAPAPGHPPVGPEAGGLGGRRSGAGPNRVRAWVLGLVVIAALAFVVLRGLGNATLFFYNADEAVAKRDHLGDDRFRLQGNVVDGTFERVEDGSRFVVSFEQVDVAVHHRGEIPKLFQAGIPVVLEGRWTGDVFDSDRMLVKHNEVYVEDNPDRVAAYDEATATTAAP